MTSKRGAGPPQTSAPPREQQRRQAVTSAGPSTREAYVYIQLPGSLDTVPAALLRVQTLPDGTQIGRFRYGDRYLQRQDAVALALKSRKSNEPLHYVDCNSITPSKTGRVAARVTAAGAHFSDGGIIGPPPGGRMKTRLYVSGPASAALTALQSDHMPVIRLGDGLSQATEMKVLFAAANKGATALLANVLAAAKQVGLLDRIVGEIDGARPGLLQCVRSSAPDLDDKAARWAIEMEDLAAGLAEMGCHPGYHQAAAESYRQLAANLTTTPTGTDPLARVLTAWAKPVRRVEK